MTKIRDSKLFNTLKGSYKPVKYLAFGLDNGVPFRRSYRSLRGLKALEKQQSITHFSYELVH